MKKLFAILAFALVLTLVACEEPTQDNGEDNTDPTDPDEGEEEDNDIEEETHYTVTFTDDDGSTIETQDVEAGGIAEEPTPPRKHWHVFSGWEGDRYNVDSPRTLEATYTSLDDVDAVEAARLVANEADYYTETTRMYLNEEFQQENTFALTPESFKFSSEDKEGTYNEAIFHEDGDEHVEHAYDEALECYETQLISFMEYSEIRRTHQFNYIIPDDIENEWFEADENDGYILKEAYHEDVLEPDTEFELKTYAIEVDDEQIHLTVELDDGSQQSSYHITYAHIGDTTVDVDIAECE